MVVVQLGRTPGQRYSTDVQDKDRLAAHSQRDGGARLLVTQSGLPSCH
jgi:hypothetical protein